MIITVGPTASGVRNNVDSHESIFSRTNDRHFAHNDLPIDRSPHRIGHVRVHRPSTRLRLRHGDDRSGRRTDDDLRSSDIRSPGLSDVSSHHRSCSRTRPSS